MREIKSSCFKEKIAKPTKEEEANDISLAVDLLTISSEKPHHAFTLANNRLEIELDARKFGWYAFPSEVVDGNSIPKKDFVIYLNSPPLSGLENFLSSMKFQELARQRPENLLQILEQVCFRSLQRFKDYSTRIKSK